MDVASALGPARLNFVIQAMAFAGLADEVRAVAGRKDAPLPSADYRIAALAIVAGKRLDIGHLQELERGLQLRGANDAARTPRAYWGLALGWALAGRSEEAASIVRAEVTDEWSTQVLGVLAVAHARAGRAREAMDVLLTLDFGNREQRTDVVRAYADTADALR